MPYSAPLDGIRALAILAVLIFHISPDALRGGFVGVDVFFVLSGFLITSILLHDIGRGTFSLREFYTRRIQRLLPNSVLTVLAVVIAWRLWVPLAAEDAGRHGLWTLGNLSNVYIWRHLGGYWGTAATSAPLLHTWSLAVEEQFYLVFPGSLILLARWQRRRVDMWVLAALLGSLGLGIYGTTHWPVATFYLLPMRVWELLLGSWLAALPFCGRPVRLTDTQREVAGAAGMLLMTVSFFVIDEAGGFPGAIALLPTLATGLVIVGVAEGQNRVIRLLSHPFFVETGKLSYSLYLWHWPLITLGKHLAAERGLAPVTGAAAGALVSVGLAWLAYRWVEQPLRNRGPGRGRRLVVIAAGIALTAGAAAAVVQWPVQVDIARWFDRPAFHGLRYSTARVTDPDPAKTSRRYKDVVFPPLLQPPADTWTMGGIQRAHGPGQPRVVVLGSSHALMYGHLVDDICHDLGVPVAFFAVDQTPPFWGNPTNVHLPTPADVRGFDAARLQCLQTWHPDVVVVMHRWDTYHDALPQLAQSLEALLTTLQPLTRQVVLVAQVPVLGVPEDQNLREVLALRMTSATAPPLVLPDAHNAARLAANALLEDVARRHPGVEVVHPEPLFTLPDGHVRWLDGRTVLYADDDHLSDAGAAQVRALLEPVLRAATAR